MNIHLHNAEDSAKDVNTLLGHWTLMIHLALEKHCSIDNKATLNFEVVSMGFCPADDPQQQLL